MNVYYRISDKSYTKTKLPGTSKKTCLENFLQAFPDANIILIADNVKSQTVDMIKSVMEDRDYEIIYTEFGNALSFNFALWHSICTLPDETIVYYCEDDYLHFCGEATFGDKNPQKIILEGLDRANYVTLYDHPDKYQSEYGFGETSCVFKTANTHWRFTISSCMTFAAKVETLKKDVATWDEFTTGSHPHDHQIFKELNSKGRTLAVCIPGLAYHVDLTYPILKSNVDNMIEPWALSIAEKCLCEKIKEKTGKEIGSNKVFGYKKLMLLDSYFISLEKN